MKARPITEKELATMKQDPKVVAKIKICGAIQYTVTEDHNFIKPTPEQVKNLKSLLNIDVEVIEDDGDGTEEPEDPASDSE